VDMLPEQKEMLLNHFPSLVEVAYNLPKFSFETQNPPPFSTTQLNLFLSELRSHPTLRAFRIIDEVGVPDLPQTFDLHSVSPKLKYVVWEVPGVTRAYILERKEGVTSAVATFLPRRRTWKYTPEWTDQSIYDHINGKYDI